MKPETAEKIEAGILFSTIIACIVIIAALVLLNGCVGNKANVEATALKIERKPSPAEEAQGWASAIKTLWSPANGTDSKPE